MKNKNTISAIEINKFLYCPYQWFYEKKYGKSELLRLNKLENNEYSGSSNFERGKEFHSNYHKKYKLFVILKILAVIAIAALVIKCIGLF